MKGADDSCCRGATIYGSCSQLHAFVIPLYCCRNRMETQSVFVLLSSKVQKTHGVNIISFLFFAFSVVNEHSFSLVRDISSCYRVRACQCQGLLFITKY